MKIDRVAAQLYTVRDFLKTPPDIARSLRRVREIGYRAVQISGMGPIPEAELRRILDGEGLVCCATHEGRLVAEPEAVVERLRRLGCRYTAVPSPGGARLETLADVRDFAGRLNRAGRVLFEAGQALTYHNHNVEFRRVEGRLILERLYDETDPRYVQGEIDTFWVQYGGGDPAAWCARLKGRLPLLHMKDYATDASNKHAFAEIGRGNLDWGKILGAAEASGCEWFIVEQDTCPGDPFESLRISFDFIREHLCT